MRSKFIAESMLWYVFAHGLFENFVHFLVQLLQHCSLFLTANQDLVFVASRSKNETLSVEHRAVGLGDGVGFLYLELVELGYELGVFAFKCVLNRG
jgi:hypothetical protein